MNTHINYIFKAQCPYLNRINSISVDYLEVPTLGTAQCGYKKGNYYCDYMNNCPFPAKDKWGRCPVYLSAPSQPH